MLSAPVSPRPERFSAAGPPADERFAPEVSFVDLLNVLLRARRGIARTVFLTLAAVLALTLVWPRSYASRASFMPQARKTSGGSLVGLAAQFGVDIPQGDPGQSPAFYAELLRSDDVLRTAVRLPVVAQVNGRPVVERYADMYDVGASAPALRELKAIETLRQHLTVSVEQRTGVVEVAVEGKTPEQALALTRALLNEVDRFNTERRRTQASSERHFLERRVADARSDLRGAEDRLQSLLYQNRGFGAFSEIALSRERLQREVSERQQLYGSLTQAFEQARLEEVRDTPVITVVEPPELPVRPEPRRLALKLALAFFVSLFGACLVALLRGAIRRSDGSSAPDAAEFRGLSAAFGADLRRPWRLLVGRRERLRPAHGGSAGSRNGEVFSAP